MMMTGQQRKYRFMPTELVDANTEVNQASQLDENRIAENIYTRLASRLESATSQKEQSDEIRDAVSQLKGLGVDEADITSQITTMLQVDKRLDRKLQEATKTAEQRFLQQSREKELKQAIKRSIKSYAKEDPLIAAVATTIEAETLNELRLSNAVDVRRARESFLQGEIDEDTIDAIISKQVGRIEKLGGKKGNATPSLSPSTTTVRPAQGEGEITATVDTLTPIQENIYNAHLSQMIRSGMKREDASKRALVAAANVKK
jgi:hypothetical protein